MTNYIDSQEFDIDNYDVEREMYEREIEEEIKEQELTDEEETDDEEDEQQAEAKITISKKELNVKNINKDLAIKAEDYRPYYKFLNKKDNEIYFGYVVQLITNSRCVFNIRLQDGSKKLKAFNLSDIKQIKK